MATNETRASSPDDPALIGILLGAAASVLAQAVVAGSRAIYKSLHDHKGSSDVVAEDYGHGIRERVAGLDGILGEVRSHLKRAQALIKPATTFSLGVPLLLGPNEIQEYHAIRDELLALIRRADDTTNDLLLSLTQAGLLVDAPVKVDQELKVRINFIEEHLKKAKTATLAEELFLEIEAVMSGIERSLAELKRHLA
jgi:hypothetical protein